MMHQEGFDVNDILSWDTQVCDVTCHWCQT